MVAFTPEVLRVGDRTESIRVYRQYHVETGGAANDACEDLRPLAHGRARGALSAIADEHFSCHVVQTRISNTKFTIQTNHERSGRVIHPVYKRRDRAILNMQHLRKYVVGCDPRECGRIS